MAIPNFKVPFEILVIPVYVLAILKIKVSVPVFVKPPSPVIAKLEIFTATLLLSIVKTLPFKLIFVKLSVFEGDDVVDIKVPIVAAVKTRQSGRYE